MSVDTDINNYNYQELLNIFKIDNTHSKDNIKKIQDFCLKIKNNVSHDIYIFFFKAYKIINCVYELFNHRLILNLEDFEKINYYVDKIKKISNFEKYDNKIVEKFVNKSEKKELNDTMFIINSSDSSILNETNYNLDTKPLTNLNNKNNTNIILDSFTNSISPGDLNSIKRITLCQNLNLNSCFRNNYFTSISTDFQYLIPCEIKNVVSMRLASIEIPNAWYLFSTKQGNNCFRIITNKDNVCTEYDIIIPDGNYDNETLQHFLNTTYFCDSTLENSLRHIRFVIDSYSFKSKFETIISTLETDNFSFSLYFFEDNVENIMNTAGWILGFRISCYLCIKICIQSEGLFDGSGDRYIYFALNDYQYNNNSINIVGFDKSIMEENILAKVPIINGKLCFIIDENNNPLTKTRKYNGPVNIRKIHVKVLDQFGNVIDLNCMNFSFTLELEILYESFNFKDVFA